jgi:hypothetical protein
MMLALPMQISACMTFPVGKAHPLYCAKRCLVHRSPILRRFYARLLIGVVVLRKGNLGFVAAARNAVGWKLTVPRKDQAALDESKLASRWSIQYPLLDREKMLKVGPCLV